jgi:hypothetical protein
MTQWNGTPVFRPASFARAGLKTGVPSESELHPLGFRSWNFVGGSDLEFRISFSPMREQLLDSRWRGNDDLNRYRR